MAIYTYKGLDRTGKEIKSTVSSDSVAQAKQKLKGMGIMLIDIKEQKSAGPGSSSIGGFGNSIKIEDLSLMTRQFSTLIRAKIQIVEALQALENQSDHPKMKEILSNVKQKVNEGSSLSKAFGEYPKVFNNVYINMVDAGETSGTLQVVLLRLAEFTEAQYKLKNRIKSALTYPMIMMGAGALMMGIIFAFVIPEITKIFKNTKKELPVITQISIGISDFVQNYWWAVIIGLFVGYKLFIRYINTEEGRKKWDRFLLFAPVVSELTMMINVSRFCSTLATLLNSGVPILTAMKITRNLMGNVHIQKAVEESKDEVAAGASMTGPLVNCGYFPAMVTHMIKLGENSGELEPMLEIVAENYEEQVENKLSGLTALLEPVMIVVMGVSVAFIVFSVVMPMMELNKLR